MIIETLAFIDNPGQFWCGLVLRNDVVVECAPIIGYMKKQKWTRERVREYCKKKGWTVKVVHELQIPEEQHDETLDYGSRAGRE